MGPQDVRRANLIEIQSARRLAYVYSATAGFSVVREFLIEGGQPDGLGAGLGHSA